MSDEMDSDSPYDAEELQEAFGDGFDGMTPEEVFDMVMINKKRLVKTKVELRDEHGEAIQLHEVLGDLLEYMNKKLKAEDENQLADQIFPMMGQALASGLGRLIGIRMTGFYLANEVSRHSFVHMMCLSFLLLKYVQDKKLTLLAIESPVTQEEVDSLKRKSRANSVAMVGAMMGMDPKELLKELVNKGEISEEDVADVLREAKSDEPKSD